MAHRFELVDSFDTVREWRHSGNGLTVLCCPTPVAPVVSFGVVYRVGSRHEGTGQTGATHLLEHLMFKGTERFNRERGTEIPRVLQRVGAQYNATTWLDRTNYYETLPAEELGLAADIESDRMRGALVRDEDLERERTVVLNEMERGENEPFELLMRGSFAHAFVEHPYRHPTIGWRGDVEGMSGAVLRGFYDTYYHPDNATVIVAGEVVEPSLLDELEQRFGGYPRGPGLPGVGRVRESEQRGERRFTIHRSAEVGHLAMSWHIPHGLHPDLPVLSVLTQILSEGVTSRLYQKLVETNRCLGIHAYALELHDPGLLQVLVTLAPGVPHGEVEELIRAEIGRIEAEPPEEAELDRAKTQVRTDLAFHRESPGQIVAGLTEAVAVGDWRRFLREMELVEAVTADDLSRVAGAFLGERNLTVGWLVPDGASGSSRVGGAAPEEQQLHRPPGLCFLRQPFAERVSLHQLPGGARLAVLPNRHAPTVSVAGTVQAGVAWASDGRFSVPSLTAAMLERGTRQRSRMELAQELEDHGLHLGVEASGHQPTSVTFLAQGLAEELPRLATLLVEVLREPTFPLSELDKVREQVLGSLARERQETTPRAYSALCRRLYPPGHPHHRRLVDEREAEVASLTPDDLAAFHRATYGPASMVLAAVGDVEPDEVAARLSDLLAGWEGGHEEPLGVAAPMVNEPGEELVDIADRPNLDVFLGHQGRLLRGDPGYPAALLANSCLGQSTLTSRLGRVVRDTEGLTYGIYSRFFGTLLVPGPWAVFLTVAPANLRRAEQLCRSLIADYVTTGPEPEELADERLSMAGSYRVGLATNAGVARELVTVLTAREPIARLDDYPEQLLSVTREQVVAALERLLMPDRLVLTAAGTLAGVEGVLPNPRRPAGRAQAQ